MKLKKNDIILIIVVLIIGMESNGIKIHLNIKNGAIAFVHSECPDHICERFGYIKNVGESAICLPAQASVTIVK